jgi:uncharacterized protein YkwD
MRKPVIALAVAAAVLVPLSGTPVPHALPAPEPLVESHRVEVHVEITFAPPPSPSDRVDLAGQLFRMTNDSRAGAGLKPLRWWRDAVHPAAEAQTDRMVVAGRIFHNPSLDRLLYALRAQTIAENVGMGPSITSLHRAFMKSKDHRRNILDPTLTFAAVWAVQDVDGVLFVTVVFGRLVPRPAPSPKA